MNATDPFAGLTPPQPPEELRRRVLTAAYRAAAAPQPGLVDRLWASRRLRMAWVVAVVLLAVANGLLPGGPTHRVWTATVPPVVAVPGTDSDLVAAIGALPATGPLASDRRLLRQLLDGTAWNRS